jgi:hypothetical protein
MRLKVILPVLISGVAIIGGAMLLASMRQQPVPAEPPVQQSAEAISSNDVAARPVVQKRAPSMVRPLLAVSTDGNAGAAAPDDPEQYRHVRMRIAELDEMAMSGEPESLREILTELGNLDPRIRMAAVDAAVQFKSPDAIPILKDALEQTADLDEKVHLKKAIDFLTLAAESQPTAANP